MGEDREIKKENDSLVTDLIEGQKNTIKFYQILIAILLVIILAQGLYHDFKWSQFETVVVDSGDGGYANYIGNDGDINYGESGSTSETKKQQSETENN